MNSSKCIDVFTAYNLKRRPSFVKEKVIVSLHKRIMYEKDKGQKYKCCFNGKKEIMRFLVDTYPGKIGNDKESNIKPETDQIDIHSLNIRKNIC